MGEQSKGREPISTSHSPTRMMGPHGKMKRSGRRERSTTRGQDRRDDRIGGVVGHHARPIRPANRHRGRAEQRGSQQASKQIHRARENPCVRADANVRGVFLVAHLIDASSPQRRVYCGMRLQIKPKIDGIKMTSDKIKKDGREIRCGNKGKGKTKIRTEGEKKEGENYEKETRGGLD